MSTPIIIPVTLTVTPTNGSDPDKVRAAIDTYLRDILWVGAEASPDDPFVITDISVTI